MDAAIFWRIVPAFSGSGSGANVVGGVRDSSAFTTDDDEGIWKEEENDLGDEGNEESEFAKHTENEDDGDDAETKASTAVAMIVQEAVPAEIAVEQPAVFVPMIVDPLPQNTHRK